MNNEIVKLKKIAIGMVAACLVLSVIVVVGLFGKKDDNKPKQEEIPTFVGKEESDVIDYANSNKITVKKVEEYSDTVSKGYVIRQTTEKDQDNNTVMTIVISKGKDPNSISEIPDENGLPDFTKMTKQEIIKFCDEHGLEVKFEYSMSELPTGTILSQVPKESVSYKEGDTIRITISEGQQTNIENLLGKSKDYALAYINKIDCKYQLIEEYSNQATGTIIGQTPGNGKIVNNGDVITIKVSIGKPYIRNYTHMSYEELEKYISDINKIGGNIKLNKISEKSNEIKNGDIISMSGDDYFAVGSTIDVHVSSGEDLSYKNFAGWTVDEFNEWAIGKNINVEYVEKYSLTVDKGIIISSSPTDLQNSGKVTIEYSVGEYKIPNIIRWSLDEVEDELVRARQAGARVTTEYIYEHSDQYSEGRIMDYVQHGDHIIITVSEGRDVSQE